VRTKDDTQESKMENAQQELDNLRQKAERSANRKRHLKDKIVQAREAAGKSGKEQEAALSRKRTEKVCRFCAHDPAA